MTTPLCAACGHETHLHDNGACRHRESTWFCSCPVDHRALERAVVEAAVGYLIAFDTNEPAPSPTESVDLLLLRAAVRAMLDARK